MGCVMLITNSECSVTRMATGVKKMREKFKFVINWENRGSWEYKEMVQKTNTLTH